MNSSAATLESTSPPVTDAPVAATAPSDTGPAPAPAPAPAPPTPPPASGPLTCNRILGTVAVLSEAEQADYAACEAIVQKAWPDSIELGLALARIRDRELYRAEYNDFKDYFTQRWQLQPNKVYALIATARTFSILAAVPDLTLPEHESQLRPLLGLKPDEVQMAWQCALGKAVGRKVTARLVQSTVKELQFSVEAAPVRQKVKKSAQRKIVSALLGDLLALVRHKASYEELTRKIEELHGQIQMLFAPASGKPVGR